MNAKLAAALVANKLSGSTTGNAIAVFLKSATSIQMTKTTSELFAKASAMRPNDLVGVYYRNATIEAIEADLVATGMAE